MQEKLEMNEKWEMRLLVHKESMQNPTQHSTPKRSDEFNEWMNEKEMKKKQKTNWTNEKK